MENVIPPRRITWSHEGLIQLICVRYRANNTLNTKPPKTFCMESWPQEKAQGDTSKVRFEESWWIYSSEGGSRGPGSWEGPTRVELPAGTVMEMRGGGVPLSGLWSSPRIMGRMGRKMKVVRVCVFKRHGYLLGGSGQVRRGRFGQDKATLKNHCLSSEELCVSFSDLLFSLNTSSHLMFIKNFQGGRKAIHALPV